jgi:hypothetical protein
MKLPFTNFTEDSTKPFVSGSDFRQARISSFDSAKNAVNVFVWMMSPPFSLTTIMESWSYTNWRGIPQKWSKHQ